MNISLKLMTSTASERGERDRLFPQQHNRPARAGERCEEKLRQEKVFHLSFLIILKTNSCKSFYKENHYGMSLTEQNERCWRRLDKGRCERSFSRVLVWRRQGTCWGWIQLFIVKFVYLEKNFSSASNSGAGDSPKVQNSAQLVPVVDIKTLQGLRQIRLRSTNWPLKGSTGAFADLLLSLTKSFVHAGKLLKFRNPYTAAVRKKRRIFPSEKGSRIQWSSAFWHPQPSPRTAFVNSPLSHFLEPAHIDRLCMMCKYHDGVYLGESSVATASY